MNLGVAIHGPRDMRYGLQAPGWTSSMTFVGESIAKALQFMHAKGIVHRDVKPSNVMLSTIGGAGMFDCKLCDFGLARPFHPSAGNSNTITAGVQTSATVGFGTSQYMSPEQM